MGVYLAKPATEKFSAHAASALLEYGASSMQGWRTAQEDAHCCHLDVDSSDTSVFGVFDGHGGADISRFCADRLLRILTELESYKSGNIEKALEEAFLLLDKTLLEDNVRQQLMEVRSKADQGKNGGLHDEENDEDESSEVSDVSGDDPDQLKAEAQMSMADLIARIVKPKKGSPFLHKKSEKAACGTSKLATCENGASDASPLTTSTSSGRKRAWCPSKDVKKPQEESGSSSSSAGNGEKQSSEEVTGDGADKNNREDNTPSKKAPSGVGSPPSEPQEKRPLIISEHSDENVVVSNGENGSASKSSHPDGKCPDGPLADCKQKLNNASKTKEKEESEEGATSAPDAPATAEKVNGEGKNGEKEPKVEEEAEPEEEAEAEPEEEAEEEESEEKSEEASEASSSSVEEEESEDSSGDSDQIYKEMMEDELRHEDSSDDSNEDEDLESRKIRLKKMKALGLLGGAALRRSILARSGFVDADEDDSEENEDEDDENALGPLKVRGGPDIEFLSPPDERVPGVGSGATAIVALVRGKKLYVANAGDSRCIVFKDGKTVAMSFDHKPDDAIELDRITKAGGRVTPDGRVMGGLNLSRAIGDHLYKRNRDLPIEEQMVSSKPDLKTIDLDGAEFMVLACDGIWNSMSNDEVGEFVHKRLGQMSLTQICSEVFDHCLAPSTAGDGTGCDNMTAIIVRFVKPQEGEAPKIEEIGSATRQQPSIGEQA